MILNRSLRVLPSSASSTTPVSLSYAQLKAIWENDKASWKNTLSRQQGVYIITNTDNGKLYVGIATGRNGIYQRWKNYIDNGHGGNTELSKLVEQQEKRT